MDEKKVREAIEDLQEIAYKCEGILESLPGRARERSIYKNIIQSLYIAIEALKKQLPKKLAEYHYEEPGEEPYIKYGCGNGCRIQPARSSKYCNQCGQRLVWPEE